MPFVFDSVHHLNDENPSEADSKIMNLLISYWINFATHGDPNEPGLPP